MGQQSRNEESQRPDVPEPDCAECGGGMDDIGDDDTVTVQIVVGKVRKTHFACYQRQIGHRGRQIQLKLVLTRPK